MHVKLKHTKGTEETTIYLSSLFEFESAEEIKLNTKYHLTINVKGRDYGHSFMKDEILQHSKEEFVIDEEVLAKIHDYQYTFKRALVFKNALLDEDKDSADEDEVYILMELTSLVNGQMADCLSNMLKDHFEKI